MYLIEGCKESEINLEIDEGNNVSLKLSKSKYTKKVEDFMVENIPETHYEPEDENPPCKSEAG